MKHFSLAIDMHGGDQPLPALLEAVANALAKLPEEVSFLLCGDKTEIDDAIKQLRLEHLVASSRFSIVNAPDNNLTPTAISRHWRNHPDSSLVKALTMQQAGDAHATLSAGDTGALFSSALFILGRQEKTERPALAATMPTQSGGTALLLDVGANLQCKAHHLAHFGELGASYMTKLCPEKTPKVALLNVGDEEYKGTDVIREADEELRTMPIDYRGFIEGNQILSGDVDVIVCDGFSGNALLKMAESMFSFIKSHLGDHLTSEAHEKMSLFNSELYGSVPILGLKGSVYKAHGASSTNALTHAILTAVKTVYLTGI